MEITDNMITTSERNMERTIDLPDSIKYGMNNNITTTNTTNYNINYNDNINSNQNVTIETAINSSSIDNDLVTPIEITPNNIEPFEGSYNNYSTF